MLRYLLPGPRLRRWGVMLLAVFLSIASLFGKEASLVPSASAAVKKRKFIKRHLKGAHRGSLARHHGKLPPLRDGNGQPFDLPVASAQKPAAPPPPVQKPSPVAQTKPPPVLPPSGKPPKKGGRVRKAAPTDDEMLEEAQAAYVRGERQHAIDMALVVAEKDGPVSGNAWRFIGLAACSVRSQRLATRAYQALQSPNEKKTIANACKNNGLSYKEDRFVGD